MIARGVGRLDRLVGDILDLAKLEAHRFTVLREEVDMGRLCDQAYAAFGEEARRRGIDYDSDIDAAPTIVSDGDRVLQIISNLLSNAFRWTPDGGHVELALGPRTAPSRSRSTTAAPGSAAGARADLPPVLVGRRRRHRPGAPIASELAVALGGKIVLESSRAGAAASSSCCRRALVRPGRLRFAR